jgi:hypothetical protein
MAHRRITLALTVVVLGACVATPDIEYRSDPDASDDDSSAASDARGGEDAAKPCLKKDQRCAAAHDCCSGRCRSKDDEMKCD